MDDIKTIEVRYISFPDIEDGILGFYRDVVDHECMSPRYFYKQSEKSSGFCHIRTPDEMDNLAKQINAMSRLEFQEDKRQKGFKTWLNAYALYLSEELGKALQNGGVRIVIGDVELLFKCPNGKFVPWKGHSGV
ncbi:hypothetical protein AB4114_29710 [Paenibacillus sp. 2RAB27]|uniref:hypothetical protein n=1 Tax=Paenibacillus sp. 2RAB27 TaxID=3232991 RepID=UPI003F951B20